MEQIDNLSDKTLLITSKSNKNILLNYLSLQDNLRNIKIMDFPTLVDNFLFTYDEKALYFIYHTYHLNPFVAKIILDNLKYVEDTEYKEEKLKNLLKIKKILEKENLLNFNPYFKDYLKTKEVVFYDDRNYFPWEEKIINKVKEITTVKIIKNDNKKYLHDVISFPNMEDEIRYVINKIACLINKGVDINNIKITNLNKDYYPSLKRIFNLYKIPLELQESSSLYGNIVVKEFLNNYDRDLEKTFASLKKYANTHVYQTLINICNKYYFVQDKLLVKDLIKEDIKKAKVYGKKKKKSVKEINYQTDEITDEDYVFMLNFNEGEIPKIYKDEDFITDNLKEKLGLLLTKDKNKQEKNLAKNKINSIKNLVITYKLKTFNKTCYPSSLVKEMNLQEKEADDNEMISYSSVYNELRLAKMLDNLNKYGTCDEKLPFLSQNYPHILYNKYDHRYHEIDKDKLENYLNKKLVLSYTSLNDYYKCGFKYYLANILKLDIFDETFFTFIGNLFHYVLAKYYTDNQDTEKIIGEFLEQNKKDFSAKELFFLNQLKEELYFVINTINEQIKDIKIKETLTEKKIVISKKYKNVEITFKGFVDKILVIDDNSYNILVLIDYKTGEQDIDLSLIDYGLSLQLPIYLYLVKNSEIKDIIFGGFYLQRIIHNKEIAMDNKTLKQIKEDNLKLYGYSNSDENILEKFDINFQNSSLIKGLRAKASGEFYKSAKVMNNEEINNLVDTVEEKLDLACKNILDAKFSINPKVINDENVSCKFCHFQSICYAKEDDKRVIEIKKEDDEDGMD